MTEQQRDADKPPLWFAVRLRCGEMRATINPRKNLAHCFCCQKNFNNIDLLIQLGYEFRSAVLILEVWLNQHDVRQRETRSPSVRRK